MRDELALGPLLACSEFTLDAGAISFCEGRATKFASVDGAPAGRLILKMASQILEATGRGQTAPAHHLRNLMATKEASSASHFQEVVDHVTGVMHALEPMSKRAFTDAAGAAGLAGRAGLYGSVGLGTGLGALYWLLSRHSSQDSADLESMQNQVDYYQQLGAELEDSMRNKYRYNNVSDARKRR